MATGDAEGQEHEPGSMSDDEWRTLLQLIIKHTGTQHFQQWDTFSLPLPGTTNRLYVHWSMKPPEGDEYEHLYPLLDPETGQRTEQPCGCVLRAGIPVLTCAAHDDPDYAPGSSSQAAT